MANLKLRVSGMRGEGCRRKVELALRGVAGVYVAVVDLQHGEVEVDFDDDSATADQIIAAVSKSGYGALLAG